MKSQKKNPVIEELKELKKWAKSQQKFYDTRGDWFKDKSKDPAFCSMSDTAAHCYTRSSDYEDVAAHLEERIKSLEGAE